MSDILLYHLYTGNVQKPDSFWRSKLQLLDDATQQRIQQIRLSKQRIDSICSKLMLYQMANEWCKKVSPTSHPLVYNAKGNPSLTGLALDFSVSYGADWVSVAISKKGRVGIDVESGDRNARFAQIPLIWRQKLEEHAIKQWNELEAYAKYWGLGLGIVFAKPFPADHNISIQHWPIGFNMDCCVVGAGDVNVHQRFVMLDDIDFYLQNAIA